MFGNMFGDLEAKQKELQDSLKSITTTVEVANGGVQVTANANKEITDISIDASKIDTTDTEQLEDILLLGVNRALEAAATEGASATQDMLQDMLPGGFGGLGNLFGKK